MGRVGRWGSWLLFALVWSIGVRAADAQQVDGLRAGVVAHRTSAPQWVIPTSDGGLAAVVLPPSSTDSGWKSPGVAGVLSVVVPGAGSLYAGNARHAAIHFGLDVVGWVGIMVAMAVPEDCKGGCQTPYSAAALAGLVIIPVNRVWSVVTAVGDADAHNRAAGK